MYSVLRTDSHPTKKGQLTYTFLQVDLPSKEACDEWITENIKNEDEIIRCWAMKTSSLLKFAKWQFENICIDSKINLTEESSESLSGDE